MICSFLGHRDTPDIMNLIEFKVIEILENEYINMFYVGHQGEFDRQVQKVLEKLSLKNPYIRYNIVLAYMPGKKQNFDLIDYSKTVFPDNLENIPPRYGTQ